MKTDLFTSIVAAIAGILVAYFVTNMLIPELTNVSFKTLDGSVNTSLTNPNDEIFNFRAVNPTVEVYVGQCTEYNENGECIEGYNPSGTGNTDGTDGAGTSGTGANGAGNSGETSEENNVNGGTN